MQAINHVVTALFLKKAFPEAPLPGLIIGTEAVELLWVGLNIAGVERTVIDNPMLSIMDIHLVHMPFSHSFFSGLILAVIIGFLILYGRGKAGRAIALAMALAVLSHIFLDLLVHAPDIAIAPFLESPKFGTGFYAHSPMLALVIESIWGVFCWWIYRGNWKTLSVIMLFGLFAIPSYSPIINAGEAALSGQSDLFAWTILLQILFASFLIWFFAQSHAD